MRSCWPIPTISICGPATSGSSGWGALHRFMGWDGPILTDSGGYQVFSLAHRRQLDADGVTFRSHIDGSAHRFTPERVIEIEERLGADIAMVLDECADPHRSRLSDAGAIANPRLGRTL